MEILVSFLPIISLRFDHLHRPHHRVSEKPYLIAFNCIKCFRSEKTIIS